MSPYINHPNKFIYNAIPKVAYTSLSFWFLSTLDIPKPENIHNYLEANPHLNCSYEFARQSDYFKFTFVRNPWRRVVSGYLDKLVLNLKNCLSESKSRYIVKPIVEIINKPKNIPYRDGITFREFVNYLFVTTRLDSHWKPQIDCFNGIKFDFVGKIENSEDFSHVQKETKTTISFPFVHKLKYDVQRNYPHAADMKLSELIELESQPHYKDFYTPELKEMIAQRYKKDIETFEYEF